MPAAILDAKSATLGQMMSRDRGFEEWLSDLIPDAAERRDVEVAPEDVLSYFADYLEEAHELTVNRDGFVNCAKLTPAVRVMVGAGPVVLNHVNDSHRAA